LKHCFERNEHGERIGEEAKMAENMAKSETVAEAGDSFRAKTLRTYDQHFPGFADDDSKQHFAAEVVAIALCNKPGPGTISMLKH
jgi:hypothetical protein